MNQDHVENIFWICIDTKDSLCTIEYSFVSNRPSDEHAFDHGEANKKEW